MVEGSLRSLSQAIPALASLRHLSRLCLESVSIRSLEDVSPSPVVLSKLKA